MCLLAGGRVGVLSNMLSGHSCLLPHVSQSEGCLVMRREVGLAALVGQDELDIRDCENQRAVRGELLRATGCRFPLSTGPTITSAGQVAVRSQSPFSANRWLPRSPENR